MRKTEVRKSKSGDGLWVVDIQGVGYFGGGYVQPDGSKGDYCEYSCREHAEAAENLFRSNRKPTTKDTNPKEALGIGKVPTHTIPSAVLLEMGLAMMEGGRKYGTHNYRAMGARHSTYSDAIERHRIAWWEGEDIDKESGLHHLTKIIGCCLVMRDSIIMGNDIDDRPLRYPNGLDIEHYNKLAADIIKKYPDCVEPFTEKNKKE